MERILQKNKVNDLHSATCPIPPEMLDYLETERDAIIMKLRKIDTLLIRHGRLQRETVPRRVR